MNKRSVEILASKNSALKNFAIGDFQAVQIQSGAILMIALLLPACGIAPIGPNYVRPDLPVPALTAKAGDQSLTFGDGLNYWKAFNDPILDSLMQEASNNSQDLNLASARIEEAIASLNQLNASALPTIDANLGASRRGLSENSSTFNPSIKPFSNDRQAGFTASYEIDFWGRLSRANEGARARLLAQEASRGLVLTTLYANVAQTYFLLRGLDAQMQLAQQILATRQENLALQEKRFKGGLTSQLDLAQAQSETSSIEATLIQAKQARANAQAALALLIGRPPAAILSPAITHGAEGNSSFAALYAQKTIPANLPSDLLARRPDIIAAEQLLIASNADIGIARAAYFPRLSLTAGLGLQSKELSSLFNASSLFWNLAANLTAPIFRAGAIDAQLAITQAKQKQALAQYTQTVQAAFRDVHDALNNIDAGRELVGTSTKRIDALKTTLRLVEVRYKGGYSNYLEVLNAQRDLAQAQSALIDTQRAQLVAVVSMYKALGGGWVSATP